MVLTIIFDVLNVYSAVAEREGLDFLKFVLVGTSDCMPVYWILNLEKLKNTYFT